MRKGFLVSLSGLLIVTLLVTYGSVLAQREGRQSFSDNEFVVIDGQEYRSGVLSGRITDGNGIGVAAVTVCAVPDVSFVYLPLVINLSSGRDAVNQALLAAYDPVPKTCGNWSETDQDGNYSFTYLPAGDYRISPVLYDISFSPESQTVAIPYADSLNFQVLHRDPVVKPEAEVISEESNQFLESISEDGSTFTFSQSTSELQSVAVGDVMVSSVSDMAPNGYLRRVISVSDQSGKRVVETAPAFLEDVIEEGSGFVQGTLTPAQVVSSDLYPGVKMNQGVDSKSIKFSYSLDDIPIYDHDGFSETNKDRVYASGTLEFELGFDFFVNIDKGTLENLTFASRITNSDKVEFYSDLEVLGLEAEWKIASHKFAPVTFMIGYVPVMAVPQLDVVVGVDGGVSVGWSASITHDITMRAGIEYINPSGWQPLIERTEKYTYDMIPQLHAEVTAKGYFGIRLNLYMYGLAGPFVNVFPFLELNYATLDGPQLTLSAGVDVPAGFRFEDYVQDFAENMLVLKLIEYETKVLQIKTVIYQSEGSNAAPFAPHAPYPGNGTTQTALNPALSWVGGDPDIGDIVYYDVFLEAGDSSPDERVAVALEETNFNLGLLLADTTYYWQVTATDSKNATITGPVWSFTTTSGYVPYPSDNAELSIFYPILSWSGECIAGDSVVYDVFLERWDSSPDIKVAFDLKNPNYDPGKLLANTTYYWQVIASDSAGVQYSSPVWKFTTASADGTAPWPFGKRFPAYSIEDQATIIRLSWESSDEADVYEYCYDTTNDGSCSNWIEVEWWSLGALIDGLLPATTYYWQVKAVNSFGETYANGSVSSDWSFTTTDRIANPGEMVSVPAGYFQMGCDLIPGYTYGCDSHKLLHPVYLDSFQIDKYEVTNGQYSQCVAAGACDQPQNNGSQTRPSYYDNPTYAKYPVVNVSWGDANDFCAWSGKRLPTEAEWEKAARGSADTRVFPWGNGPYTCEYANISYAGDYFATPCLGEISEVGIYSLGSSPYGVMDMAGNVEEWVADWYSGDYYSVSPGENPPGPERGSHKVIRGGSAIFESDVRLWARSARELSDPGTNFRGFRCASSQN